MSSIISLLTPTQDLQFTTQGKFEYNDFEKQVKEIKENCSYDSFLKYEARLNTSKTNPKKCIDEIMLNKYLEDNLFPSLQKKKLGIIHLRQRFNPLQDLKENNDKKTSFGLILFKCINYTF
jgi:hypothetical protein